MVAAGPVRFFSAPNTDGQPEAKPDDSIFASADYFKDVKPEDVASSADQAVTEVSKTTTVDELMFMDSNDALGTTMAFMPKDLDNLI